MGQHDRLVEAPGVGVGARLRGVLAGRQLAKKRSNFAKAAFPGRFLPSFNAVSP